MSVFVNEEKLAGELVTKGSSAVNQILDGRKVRISFENNNKWLPKLLTKLGLVFLVEFPKKEEPAKPAAALFLMPPNPEKGAP